jgi:hypothetical protein
MEVGLTGVTPLLGFLLMLLLELLEPPVALGLPVPASPLPPLLLWELL